MDNVAVQPSGFNLSPEQQRVVDHRGSPLQVIACAGSGKTESISRRVAALIEEGNPPESIVAFTFTEKAASELKERIYKRVEEIKGSDFLGRLGPMFVGTIHAYCFRILQDHVPRYGNYDVLDEHRHSALVSRRRYDLDLAKLHSRHWSSVEVFLRAADVIGNELLPLKPLEGTDIGECYAAYLDILDRYKLLTFGMIIAKAVEVLQESPAIYTRVAGRLKHLIVDEYQDINPAQEKLIELLARPPVQLCVVGDDDQAIYQWRGSDVGNILKFEARYPNVEIVKLESNRRSRPLIVDSANAFAQSIPDRLAKKMFHTRPKGPAEVVTWLGETPEAEAETIAKHIVALHEQGWRYQDMAVLFRSVRTSAPVLVEALEARGIPFNCGGRTGLFAHPEINHFGELFAWMADFSWKDERFGPGRDADLDNVVAGISQSFGVPAKEQPELKKYFEDWKSWHQQGNRRVSLVGDFYRHLQILGVEQIDPDELVGSARLGAFARFSKILADYEHVTLRSRWTTNDEGERVFRSGLDRGKSFWSGLANFMLHYAKDAYEDFEGEEIHSLDAVSILTVHQAKGLEWPILFLPGLSNKRFPSSNAGKSQDWCLSEVVFDEDKRRRYEGGDADERRLFYVALTRGRDVVYASSFSRINRAAGLSPYLLELAEAIDCDNIPELDALPLPDAPEQLKNPESPPLELGFSDLADYEDCGYSYRLSRVFGFERELAQELGYGNAVHHVLRHVAEDARETGSIPDKDELSDLIHRELYVPFANESTFANMTRSVTRLVNSYVTDWQADLKRVWATERPFEMHFEGGILAGRADVILDQENGRPNHLAIVDYKTSTDEKRDERYAKQLTIYAAAGRQEGLEVDACYVHELKSSGRKEVDVDEANTAQAVNWAATRFSEIATGVYPAKAGQNNCEKCDFKLVCRHTCVRD
jgi:DNA helicase-2/ATP-dependent DNA helicase PcrA